MIKGELDKMIGDKIDRMFKHTWICRVCGREHHKLVRKCPCFRKNYDKTPQRKKAFF